MSDAIDPSHYKAGWSDDAELISITENLTGNGAQAVQYVARSTRLDESLNKGQTVGERVEDLEKALWFISREIKRLKGNAGVETVTVPVRDYAPGGPLPKGWDGPLVRLSGCTYSGDRLASYNLMQAINGMSR